ncbi:unnamed protein product, partial [Durusdinium trenchii]
GHYWNSTTYTTDPWLTVMYNASSDPSLETSLAVPTGLMGSDILGRAMVIHDFTGARIACGLIHKATVSGFRTYPGYTGDLRTKGSMLVTSADGKQTLSWIFTGGVDASCNASACTAANCCGVHIHVGMDCSDAATVGGHYWNAEAYTTDPWLTVRYSAENVPAVASGVVVATGYDTANINKRAMVIHDFNGGRIACAPIQMPVSSAIVASWSPYPGTTYSGTVDGVMSVISSEDAMGTQTLSWSLTGLDQNCSMTCTATNCCGVHIHVGTDCSDATTIGGHYWDSSDYNTDPWLVIMYNSSSSGGALAIDVAVATGLSAADVLGRAMVIHDFTGARIACGIIGLANVPSFSPYPTYTGSLMTAGNMAVTSLEGVQTLSWILTAGLDTQCMGTCSATNCCGVHIHAGTDCTDASTVGGHYYDSNALASDPWLTITYDASEMPSVKKDVMVTTGLNTADVTGHTMVIHDYSGGRIACGIISLDMEPIMATTECSWHCYCIY